MSGALSLTGLVKKFGDEVAVDGIDLEIGAGEFFSLLGPSGCGKTTTLRMIAGFEQPDGGSIHLDGASLGRGGPAQAAGQHGLPVLRAVPVPRRRRQRRVRAALPALRPRQETKRRVGEALDHVQMESFAKRKPYQLSGGQQQRVALARALVLAPTVLLLDEPMGALDAKLRKQLQLELRQLQREVGTTFVYVTHDQEEALTMSDRLAVMHGGKVMQVGTPQRGLLPARELLRRHVPRHHQPLPRDRHRRRPRRPHLRRPRHPPRRRAVRARPRRRRQGLPHGPPGTGRGRPPRRNRHPGPSGPDRTNHLPGKVEALVFRGAHTGVILNCNGVVLEADVANHRGEPPAWLNTGSAVRAKVSPAALRLLVS